MNSKPIHRKRTVEIYFILYLAALLFLLPDAKNKDVPSMASDRFVAELYFNIYPEKTNLTARVYQDSSGYRILSLDSNNSIFYSGDVKNIKYEFTVFDAMMKQSLQLRPETGTKYYRVVENLKNKSVLFYWSPSEIEENKSYIVQVHATAEPIEGNPNILYQAKTQFSLNVLLANKFIQRTEINQSAAQNTMDYNALLDSIRKAESLRYSQTVDFDLSPEKELIRQLAYQKWVNIIYFYNIDLFKDLKNKPQILISGDANSRFLEVNTEIARDRIIISGVTPPSGKINVKVVADRKIDAKQKSISFTVKPLPIESAQFENNMYVGKSYWIDPKFPIIPKEIRAVLKLGSQIIVRSPQGSKFQFTPEKEHIGRTLELERYIDNTLVPEENKIKILDYPLPEIIAIQEVNSSTVQVVTKVYGSIGGEKNMITKLEIVGEIQYRELFGRFQENKDNFSRIQTFEITAKKSGIPLKFSIIAIDKSGKKSSSRSFSSE